ncbi:DUF4328 domain-containing protein [Lihuaxuella thermophila]|uniref:DUF4328 domain-containing protein n=1 Tax=Lihuaxuella thermophila TaxID=1173111 RepID=A0A1H8G015_9BACL|nr:DUF4328 domain-containing protein [Lihuaxuella thermophila]SEN36678.1 protein of unknown function [Lihuaxuella thermophila]
MYPVSTTLLPYQSPKSRAKILQILLIVNIVFTCISMIGEWIAIGVYSDSANAIPTDEETLMAEGLTGITGILFIPVYLATIVVFCIWIHRIYKNLPLLGAKNLRMTPGWAVGWYFVPFANLVKPYQGMKDAWNACSLDADQGDLSWGERSAPGLIKWWWGFWLFSNSVSKLVVRIYNKAETTDELISAAKLSIFSGLIDLKLTVLALILVKRLTERQEKKWQALQTQEQNFTSPFGFEPDSPQMGNVQGQPLSFQMKEDHSSTEPSDPNFKWG